MERTNQTITITNGNGVRIDAVIAQQDDGVSVYLQAENGECITETFATWGEADIAQFEDTEFKDA